MIRCSLVAVGALVAMLTSCSNEPVVIHCGRAGECPAGRRCVDTARFELQCLESCGSPEDGVFEGEHCSPGVQCIGYACYPAGATTPGEPCNDIDECTDGYACSSREELADPTCVRTCVGVYYDDTVCPDGSICTQRSICIPACDPASANPCPQEGYLCLFGECRAPGGWNLCFNPEHPDCPPELLCDTIGRTFECIDTIEYNRRHPRPEGGRCHEEGTCPP